MLRTSRKIFIFNRLAKHVKAKTSHRHNFLLMQGPATTCIRGLKYFYTKPALLSDKKEREVILINQRRAKALQQNSKTFYDPNQILKQLKKAVTDNVYNETVLLTLLKAAKNVDKNLTNEFVDSYYEVLQKLPKLHKKYYVYYEHYCALKEMEFKNDDYSNKYKTLMQNIESVIANQKELRDLITKEHFVELAIEASRVQMVDSEYFNKYYEFLQIIDYSRFPYHDRLNESIVKNAGTALAAEYNVQNLIPFLSTYAFYVKAGKEQHSKTLVQLIFRHMKRNKNPEITTHDYFSVLKSMALMNEFDKDYVKLVIEIVKKNPEFLEQSNEDLLLFVKVLSECKIHEERNWPNVRSFLLKLRILQKVNEWKNVNSKLNLYEYLGLLGIDHKHFGELKENSDNISNGYSVKLNSSDTSNNNKDISTGISKELEDAIPKQISNEDLTELLSKAYKADFQSINSKFFDNYYKVLQKLNSSNFPHAKYSMLKSDFLRKIILGIKEKVDPKIFIPFLSTFAQSVKNGEDEYSKPMMVVIVDGVQKSTTISIEDKFSVLKAMGLMGHVDNNYMEHVKNLIMENPEFLEESVENICHFMKVLNNYKQSSKSNVKSFLESLQVCKNIEKWKIDDLQYLEDFVRYLQLFDIEADEFEKLLEKHRNGNLDFDALRASEETLRYFAKKAQNTLLNKDTDLKFFEDYYEVLQNLNYTERSDYEKLRTHFENKLITAIKQGINSKNFITFFLKYLSFVSNGKEICSDKMYKFVFKKIMDDIVTNKNTEITTEEKFSVLRGLLMLRKDNIEYLKYLRDLILKDSESSEINTSESSNFTIDEKFLVLKGMALMRYSDVDYVEYMKNLVIKNPGVLEESPENLYAFAESLVLCDYQNNKSKFWPYVKRLIAELNILQDGGKWDKVDIFYHLNVAKLLALWGIYSKPFLTSLSEKCNNQTFIENVENLDLLNLMISLNQVVYALLPSFNKPFLYKKTQALIVSRIKTDPSFNEEKIFNESLKRDLEKEIGLNDCVLANCATTLGLQLDLAVCVNEANDVFNLSKCKKFQEKIERISVPNDFQLLLLVVVRNEGAVNSKGSIESKIQLDLKSLQASGFKTISILKSDLSESDEHRGSRLWEMIRNKDENSLSKEKDPVIFE